MRLIGGAFEIHRRWPVVALSLASLGMLCVIFAPYAAWPLAYVCLAPWVIALCASTRARFTYVVSYLLGVAFFAINLRWLRFSTMPGYIALSVWSGVHFLYVGWIVRSLYRRRRMNLAMLLPVVWVMSELLRSRTAVGFPWFLLAHSHYKLLTMIQISDVGGAFLVSFVIAAVNGLVCELLLSPILIWRRDSGVEPGRARTAIVFSLVLVGATVIYGQFRLRQSRFDPGPLVAVLQGDYTLTVDDLTDPNATSDREKKRAYFELLAAAAPRDPDLFVFPETPWSMYLNREYRELEPTYLGVPFSRECHDEFHEISRTENAYIVVGSVSFRFNPGTAYPRFERFNSAFVYGPLREEPQRYDKIHLVLFGEYVPFRNGVFHWFYRKLNALTPWGVSGEEYSLTPGDVHAVFEMQAPSQDGQVYRFATPICYEDAIPELISEFVMGRDGRKRVDFLLNISNDGWFWHSTELPQHLAVCAFRAVENRVGFARAVNTGISGFIDPDGQIRDVVSEPGKQPWQGVQGFSVSRVMVDSRRTLYSRWGDWFAACCLLAGLAGAWDATVARFRKRRMTRRGTKRDA